MINLPHENPEYIYEGLDQSLYEPVTGATTNRAPKQIQENVKSLRRELEGVTTDVASINRSGDGAIMDNRTNTWIVPADIFDGTRITLPEGFTVNGVTQEIVLTDVDSGKHYYYPFHFSILDSKTLESKTNITRGKRLLFRVWNKQTRVVRTLLDYSTTAGKKIPVPTNLDYIPTVHSLLVQVDGITQREYTYEDGFITFGFDLTQGQEIIFISIF